MPKIDSINLFQIRQVGLEALACELGPVAMIRFLQQYEVGSGDYSKDRHEWLDNLTVDEVIEKIKQNREQPK